MDDSSIIHFDYIGKEEIHKCIQYEATMTVYIGRIANQVPKWLPFKN